MSSSKEDDIQEVKEVKEVSPTTRDPSSTVDSAWKFLQGHQGGAHESVDLKALRRKIDRHLILCFFCGYTLQFLDKVILNYAAVMGIREDLSLVGNDFSNLATFLFVGLLVFEIPNIYFLQKFPAAKWLGLNITLWGIATACGAAAINYQTLLVSRIFLGMFEATIAPSLILISSMWYTKPEQAPRFALWYLGLGFGQIVGGLTSFGFQHVSPAASLAGWRIMFITLGCITVVVGLWTFFFIPDTPMKARWLTDDEKTALLKHVSVNNTGIQNRKFQPKQILEALIDPQLWLLIIAVISLSVSSGVVTTYSVTLTRNLGYTPKEAALLGMGSGAVSIFFTLLVGFGVRKHSHRWAFAIVCIMPAILGGGLMSFLPETNKSGILAGIILVNSVVPVLSLFYQLTAANIGGSTKRPFAAAVISGSFSIGNIIGPQTFQARDAPEYRPAKIAVMATQAGCALTVFVLFLYYVWQNRKRAAMHKNTEEEYLDPEVWASMTDKQNTRFRYTY